VLEPAFREHEEEVDVAGARDLAEGFYDAFNRGDLDAAREYFSDDVENWDPSGTLRGWESFRQYIGVFKEASPDSKLNVKTWIDGGDVVAMEGTFTGTFTNPLPTPGGELKPTGEPFEVLFVEVNEARGGRITSHRVYYDQMAFLAALGAMPPQGAPAAGES
jgi:ketosteroid isomerase-like protein